MSDKVFNALRISLFSALVVWGLYTLIAYLAVPVHQSVLLSETGRQAVVSACGANGSVLCQGWNAIGPFIAQTFAWAQPFWWYGILSALIFAVFIGLQYLRRGEWSVEKKLTPLSLIIGFFLSLWLIFTVISFGSAGDQPFTRLFEPLPQVYTGADAEGLQVLQENFANLKERGCLTQIATTQNGAGVFDMSRLCMQTSFITRVMPQALFVLYVFFVFLVLGRFLLQLLRIPTKKPLAEMVFSAGIGSCGLIVILWLLAYIGGVLESSIYSQVAGWGIVLVIPAALYQHARYWTESLWKREWTYEGMAYTGALIIGWLLISYLALNFFNVVRPFPIGWDDLGKYINQPRLLVSYGYFIPQLATFQWEYITSIGFLLFGYESIFGATASMMMNWMAGVLAVLAVYSFGYFFLGKRQGLLSALLYYTLPVVGHFSYADMKVDNAVFAMGALSLLAVFLALFPTAHDEGEAPDAPHIIDWRWLVLAGILGGFAFSLKATSIMTLMALGVILFGVAVHWTAFLGTLCLAWVIYIGEGRFNLSEIGSRIYGDPTILSKPVFLGAFLVLGIGLTAYAAYLRPQAFKATLKYAGIFIASFAVSIAPWLITNNIAAGNVVPKLALSAPNNLSPTLLLGKGAVSDPEKHIIALPAELQIDDTQCTNTAKSEELDRYWGYHTGWRHYLTLPWRSVMNLDSAGYYVTTFPALLLFPLLLLLPFFWSKEGRWLRWLFAGTVFMLVQWVFFANGIPWYGLGTYFGLVVGLEAFIWRSPDLPSKIVSSVLVALSLLVAFSMRFWQYDQQKNLFEYPLGKISYEAMRERTIPHYDDVREIIENRRETMPDRPYVYRVGTFIPYFIPRNLEVLPVGDHQMDFFKCLYSERDAALTLKRLQALGFNSIIFDTNTQTIERDPNGSLHQKVNLFIEFVNTPGLGMSLPINDPENGIAYILLP